MLTKMFGLRYLSFGWMKPKISAMGITSLANIPIPPDYSHVHLPENEETRKLKILDAVPLPPNNTTVMKRQRKIEDIRGPETIHNRLIYKQYGVVALGGGHISSDHVAIIRNLINKKLDFSKCFAVWRIDAPWKPITKKGVGKTLGGGKGNIHHYATPVRAGRVIIEVAGHLEFAECVVVLTDVANRLPCLAMPVEQSMYDEIAKEQKRIKDENINPLSFKFMYQNNIGGCKSWLSPYHEKWDGHFY